MAKSMRAGYAPPIRLVAKPDRRRVNALPPGRPDRRRAPWPSPDDVARRAFELFCEQGCRHGHDLEHWFQAEGELHKQATRVSARPPRLATVSRLSDGRTES